ncbi:MAG: thiol reductant ABC exporter subunit CydC [Kocuria sp.]|nr:thiol reductant ABC exporter subunit CydC [Kocuria sp.]
MSVADNDQQDRRRANRRPPLGPHARRVLPVLGVLSALRALGLVGFSAAVGSLVTALAQAAFAAASHGVGGTASTGWTEFIGSHSAGADGILPHWLVGADPGVWSWGAVVLGVASLALRALADWGLSVAAQRAATETKSTIRQGVLRRVLSAPRSQTTDGTAASDGAVAVLVSRGLDALDDYYVKTITALVSTGVIPAILLVVVLLADPISALVLVLTLPLVPVFMVLIGKTTQNDTREAQSQLLRLSQHIVELSRGLPVLVGLKREKAQSRALNDLGESYRKRTMTTLRSAFQSSLALELITTISVALVAVFIGLRLVSGQIGLDTALLVLLLAPECFQPLRDVGTAFHQSQDGVDALRRSEEILEEPTGTSVISLSSDPEISVSGLTVEYAGRGRALDDLSFILEPRTTTLLTGPSGCGKTTLLKTMADMVRDGNDVGADDGTTVAGSVSVPDSVAWIGQSPGFIAATVVEEVGLYANPENASTWLRDVMGHDGESQEEASRIRELWNPVIEASLKSVGLEDLGSVAPAALSAGQARRLAIARVLAAVRPTTGELRGRSSGPSQWLVLVDEPTAHLDRRAAGMVSDALRELTESGATILWVTHDPAAAPTSAGRIELDSTGRLVRHLPATRCEPFTSTPEKGNKTATDVAGFQCGHRERRAAPQHDSRSAGGGSNRSEKPGVRETLRTLFRVSGLRASQVCGSVLLSFLTVAFGASLTALSGWLIVRASQQPGMMYLMVAIVGVRFFGLGRAVFRYLERLLTHDVVLKAANRLRSNAWESMGETALSLRSLLRGGTFLDRLVGDVDEVRDSLPRVLLPMATNIPTMIAAVIATYLTVPPATWVVAAAALVTSLLAPWLVLIADQRAETVSRDAVQRTLRGALGVMESAEDLKGNRLSDAVLGVLAGQDRLALAAARRSATASGLGNELSLATWWAAALAIAVIAWDPVSTGGIAAPVAAIPVLLCTALVEPSSQTIDSVRAWPAFARLVAKISPASEALESHAHPVGIPERKEEREPTEPSDAQELHLADVSARWPGMEEPAIRGVTGRVGRGQALGITGPSGAGKTTTLAVLLGFLRPERGAIRVDGNTMAPEQLRGASAWCPQDAYIFDSTVRGNLLLARPRESAPSDQELDTMVHRVGLGSLLDTMEHGLDTRVGAGGSRLSGGQRQRLAMARALLTNAPFLLVDEPTAHLDEPSAAALVEELDRATRGSSDQAGPGTIVISHRPTDLGHCRSVVTLGHGAGR